MMQVYTLTASSRAQIWTRLNIRQIAVLRKYTMFAAKSAMFNNIYAQGAQWQFSGLNVDYYWDARKSGPVKEPALRCACGRYIKNQYVLQAADDPARIVKLGITHFEQELGIAPQIAREVRAKINQVQIYMDEVLTYFKWGRRFPESLYQHAQRLGLTANQAESAFWTKIADFAAADFPLFHIDQERLAQLVTAARNREAETRGSSTRTVARPQPAPVKAVIQGHSGTAQPKRRGRKAAAEPVVTTLDTQQFRPAIARLTQNEQAAISDDVQFIEYAHQVLAAGILDSLMAASVRTNAALIAASAPQFSARSRQFIAALTDARHAIARQSPVLARLWQHDATALHNASALAQMRKVILLEQDTNAKVRRLPGGLRSRFDEQVQTDIARQFDAFKQNFPGNNAPKFSLEWQLTLQKIRARALFAVRTAGI